MSDMTGWLVEKLIRFLLIGCVDYSLMKNIKKKKFDFNRFENLVILSLFASNLYELLENKI